MPKGFYTRKFFAILTAVAYRNRGKANNRKVTLWEKYKIN